MSQSLQLLPSGFRLLREIEHRRGRLELLARDAPAVLLVRAAGFVGPTLLALALAAAEEFGRAHPEGWDYVADTSLVRRVHPLNALWLRKIRSLPHVRRYLVISPSRFVRAGIRAWSWLVRPDLVVRSLAELELG